MMYINGKRKKAHRVAWENAKGPIPKGLVIDHMCRVRSCCNPDHLRLVTPKINALENNVGQVAFNRFKTVCPHGHPYDIFAIQPNGAIWRRCKKCNKARLERKNKN
jgi:hypothetical protein